MTTDQTLMTELETGRVTALLFDLDGVLTPTSDLHRMAWRQLFEPFLEELGASPYSEDDYYRYLDGKQRMDGVASLLRSREIELAWGGPDEALAVGEASVWSLAEQKNAEFNSILADRGVQPYPGSLALLEYVQKFPGVRSAVVSSSKNAPEILRISGLDRFFDAVVDGTYAAEHGLPGKPSADTFLRAAELLDSSPAQSVVFEDAVSGVEAGSAGSFREVIGVDRGAGSEVLRRAGATVVVDDLGNLLPEHKGGA
ncbi:HAD-IA family hydrolase [Actinomycetaceae bacterium MB13-C1-2]|nr:HAD-IA family hydrolase [Actinomycetaceae bacterium MB13-C1-2]